MQRLATLEYHQWRLSKRILAIANEGEHPHSLPGIRKALEVFCLASYSPRAEWPQLYSRSRDAGSEFARKLEGDFRRVKVTDPAEKVRLVTLEIRNSMEKMPAREGLRYLPVHSDRKGIRVGKFSADWTHRLTLLNAISGVEGVAAMLLRYKAALAESAQWSIPPEVYSLLHSELGCTGEGFASPLNSYLLPKRGARYCSLFPDTDGAFNSCGNVWDLDNPSDLADGWVLNPPFTLYHLNKASNLARQWLRRDLSLRVVVVGRSHGTVGAAAGGKRVQVSSPYDPLQPWVQSHIELPASGHHYMSSEGRRVQANFPSSVYICGPPIEDPSVVDRIREAFVTPQPACGSA